MSKPDYKLKAEVMKMGLDALQRKVSISMFHGCNPKEQTTSPYDYEMHTACEINSMMYDSMPLEWNEARKINNNNYDRTNRVRSRIEGMAALCMFDKSLKMIFITFTFNDKALTTKPKTRRTYVARYLKENEPLDYIANIDFGSDKEYKDRNGTLRKGTKREHYHAIALVKDYYKPTDWKNGRIDFENVYLHKNGEQLAKYINKLVNHAVKESTKRQALIYCRNEEIAVVPE